MAVAMFSLPDEKGHIRGALGRREFEPQSRKLVRQRYSSRTDASGPVSNRAIEFGPGVCIGYGVSSATSIAPIVCAPNSEAAEQPFSSKMNHEKPPFRVRPADISAGGMKEPMPAADSRADARNAW